MSCVVQYLQPAQGQVKCMFVHNYVQVEPTKLYILYSIPTSVVIIVRHKQIKLLQ